jgi:hypothetical protein
MKKVQYGIIFLLLVANTLFAGNKHSTKNNNQKSYAKFPYWIQMMDDENTNYFEAQKAFEAFWEHRERPLEENEILGQGNEKYINDDKALAKRMKKLPAESRNLSFQYKKFLHWTREVKPYVQEDGHILTKAERLKIFNEGK